jgi:molybdopterin molybdotransferase/putative molybdopterin biosynthesis protein
MKKLPTRANVIETLFQKWNLEDKTEIIKTEDAIGRILKEDVYSNVSIPVVRASAMDGVAVCSDLFKDGAVDTQNWQMGVEFCRADTGDDFDDKFDAVIPIERVCISDDGKLTIDSDVEVVKNLNIRKRGSIISEGNLVGKKNRELRSFDLACIAAGDVREVEVYKKPKVAFLPTGNELIRLGQEVTRGKNIDSNSILAKNLLLEMGAEPICFDVVKDDKKAIESALDRALKEADVVILNGGSSKGEEDFNARILEEKGVALYHWVAAAPGKPMCVAIIDNKPVINIPGPPLALLYGFDWCIREIVNRILHKPMPKRQTIKGLLTEDIWTSGDSEILCMMDIKKDEEGYKVKQKSWKSIKTPDSLNAGAIFITKIGTNGHKAGEIIEVELLRGLEDF